MENKETIRIKSEKYKKIIEDFNAIVSANDAIIASFQITIKELDDGYSKDVMVLTEGFMEAIQKQGLLLPEELKRMPITYSIENYPKPIILLSDEQELDNESQKIIRKRYENGFKTFPIIMLSDEYFKLIYGEIFTYNDIVKTLENSTKEKVMVFQQNQYKYLEEYIDIVKVLIGIHNYKQWISDLRHYLEEEIEKYNCDIDEERIFGLVVCQHIKAIIQLNKELDNIEKRFDEHTKEWNAELVGIREKYDRDVLKKITQRPTDKISPFVLNIDLKYAALQNYLRQYLEKDFIKKDYDFISKDLENLVLETEKSIQTNKAQLSLIGTFSSGKTTLINTFLGEREIPLRTSMGHNTAVLMHLYYENTNDEYYDIIYKDQLVWSVVKPAIVDKGVVNREASDIIILDILKDDSGIYSVKYSIADTGKKYTKRFRTKLNMAVKKGDRVKPGASLTYNAHSDSEMVEVCSKSEIELILLLIKQSKKYKLKFIDNTIENKEEIIRLLNKVYNIASDKSSTHKYDVFCEKIGVSINESNMLMSLKRQTSYKCSSYKRIEFECNIDKQTERKKLDRQGWIDLCGDPNTNIYDNKVVFSEAPECYMLAKEIQLHVNSEFLQYCSLTDTPGFGSVTEEHDAITERYIRDSIGHLLVMIAINAKTIDAKYTDLINNIEDIYNNFRKTDKNKVIFILNCFTNLTPEINIKQQIKNVQKMLLKYGFEKKNIYVCDLKKALVDKQYLETLYEYPSYKQFHDYIISELISYDLNMKYFGIKKKWDDFFVDSINRVEELKETLDNRKDDIQQLKDEIQDKNKKLKDIEIDNFYEKEENQEEIKETFTDMISELTGTYTDEKWKGFLFWSHIDSDKIEKAYENIKKNLNDLDLNILESIVDYYNSLQSRIAWVTSEECPKSFSKDNLKKDNNNSVAVMELIKLKKSIDEAVKETHFLNKKTKNDFYSIKFKTIINSGCEETIKKAQTMCKSYCEQVIAYKNRIFEKNESTLKGLQNEKELETHIGKLNTVINDLKIMQSEFDKIKFDQK